MMNELLLKPKKVLLKKDTMQLVIKLNGFSILKPLLYSEYEKLVGSVKARKIVGDVKHKSFDKKIYANRRQKKNLNELM